MKLIPNLSDSIKGYLLMAGGCIILLDAFDIARQALHNIVLGGGIIMFILGFFMADMHKKIYRLITKKSNPQEPPSPSQF